MNHSAGCQEGVRTSRDASLVAATSAPTVSRSAPVAMLRGAVPGLAPSRIPAGTSLPSAAMILRKPLARPSQIPAGSAGKDGVDGPQHASPVLDVVGGVLRVPGVPLDRATLEEMQPRFHADFSQVRVHTDAEAGQSASAINALAYTAGRDVVFAAGQYAPGTRTGRRLLAHELTHVIQQSLGPVDGSAAGAGVALSDRSDRFEREAEMVAERIVAGHQVPNCIRTEVPASGGSLPRFSIQRSNGSTPEGPVGQILVSPAAQEAAAPLLNSMKIDAVQAASFYRGEMVVGEITTQGDAMIVFFQLKEGRLRAGIFSINVKGNPRGAVRAFSSFRGNAQQFARALQVPEVELMGAAVANQDVAAMLERQGFVKSAEPLPESLGARAGETIEVYSKRFPIATETAGVSAAGPSSGAVTSETAGAVVASEAETAGAVVASEAETAAVFGGGARAASLAGRLAIGLLEAAVLVIVTLGLEYLKRKADEEHLRRDLEAAQPKIASSITALMPQARLLQQRSASQTTWAAVSIELHSWFTEMYSSWGPATTVDLFQGASFLEPATLSLQYRRDRREQRGEPMRQFFEGGSSNSYHLRDIVTFSIPIPYDADTLDAAGRRARIAKNEGDAAIADLPYPVLKALFDERDSLLRPPAAGRSMLPPPFLRR